ncbi:MAG: hypothetical protein GXO61_02865 [Epsilonproteobacteria bacterium]|nr:hypothetical protein [Campylobacterota bacterium]
MKTVITAILALFLLAGCGAKQPKRSQAVVVVFKTPKIKFSGSGFLYHDKNKILLEGYQFSNPVFKLSLTNRVCINKECLSFESFNNRFLSPHYPKFLLKNILSRKPIFNKEGFRRERNGFSQEVYSNNFDIIYEVDGRETYFRDKKNHILIKVRSIDG